MTKYKDLIEIEREKQSDELRKRLAHLTNSELENATGLSPFIIMSLRDGGTLTERSLKKFDKLSRAETPSRKPDILETILQQPVTVIYSDGVIQRGVLTDYDPLHYIINDDIGEAIIPVGNVRQLRSGLYRPHQTSYPEFNEDLHHIQIDGEPLLTATGNIRRFQPRTKMAKLAKLLCDAGANGISRKQVNELYKGNPDTAKSKVADLRQVLRTGGYTIETTPEIYRLAPE